MAQIVRFWFPNFSALMTVVSASGVGKDTASSRIRMGRLAMSARAMDLISRSKAEHESHEEVAEW